MANTIQSIVTPADVVPTTAPAQVSSGGAVASKLDTTTHADASNATAAVNASTQNSSNQAQASGADLRLEIEDDKAAGCFVYKIYNRVTGEVVQQIPQEQIVKMREADGYMAGDLIKSQA